MADTGGGHQAPAHLIIPDNGQQTAMQDDDLFAKRPPDNEHRFDQHRQVGEVLNKLPDAGLKLHLPNYANLETEVAQSAAQVILDWRRKRPCASALRQPSSGGAPVPISPFSDWKKTCMPAGTKFATSVGIPMPRFTSMPDESSWAVRRAMMVCASMGALTNSQSGSQRSVPESRYDQARSPPPERCARHTQ